MRAVTTAPIRGPAAWRRTLEVRERYLAAGDADRLPPATSGVRPEIVSSWRRCLLSGVDASATDLPRDEYAAPPERLVRAARPVAERLADQLAGMRVWAFLADRECRLVWYVAGTPDLVPLLEARGALPGARFAEDVVGTNGLGTAVEERRPFLVAGSEHFRAHESHATTAGSPVRDPVTGRLAGLLNVNCRYESTNGLLLPFVTELARSIETNLRRSASMSEQELLDEFLRVSRLGSRAVVAVGPDLFIANGAARALLHGVDIEPLRALAGGGRARHVEVLLEPDLPVTVEVQPTSGISGAVVVLSPTGQARRPYGPVLPVAKLARPYGLGQPVLLRGEPGTGRATLARELHGGDSPLSIVDAGAVTPAREWTRRLRAALADPAGTVLLRHLDDLPPALVARTAVLIETARARLVATATATDRADLAAVLQRFAVVVDVPPLRDRVADLPALIAGIIAELHPQAPRPRCTPEAVAALASGEWPGNLHQLRQVVATAMTRSLSGQITLDDLPDDLTLARHRRLTRLERLERLALVSALREAAGDRDAAARELGISRATIYRKLRSYGIRWPARQRGTPSARLRGAPRGA